MAEADVMRRVMLDVSSVGARVFRNNVAKAWIGESRVLPNGDVLIKNARRLHAGLCVGSSDIVGWTPVVIQDCHVGRTLAVFTALEVKKGRRGATDEQANFVEQVAKAGGVAGIVRSSDEAVALISARREA